MLEWWATLSPITQSDFLDALEACGYERSPLTAFMCVVGRQRHIEELLAGTAPPAAEDGLSEADWRVLEPVLADPDPKPSDVF